MTHDVVIMRRVWKHSKSHDRYYLRGGKFYHEDYYHETLKVDEITEDEMRQAIRDALSEMLHSTSVASLYITNGWYNVIKTRKVW